MYFKKKQHRVFDYPPRFYDPENDPKERRKRKLKFRSFIHKRKKSKPIIVWILLIAVIIFLYMKFGGGV